MEDQETQQSTPDPAVCQPGMPDPAPEPAKTDGSSGVPAWVPPESSSPTVDQARADVHAGMYDDDKADAGAPDPDAKKDEPSVRDQFQQKAYDQLGVSKEEFEKMDPQDRNAIITRAYAKMYESDPQDMKWAGMAAYASHLVGDGMEDSGLAGLAGGPGDELKQSLADGNAGVYQDVMWQHLAFQQGGMEALKKAAEQGQLPKDQLDSWQKIADAQKARQDAAASGDPDAQKRADDLTWQGNQGLLEHEQKVLLQNVVYDQHPEAYKWLSENASLASPVPDGTRFQQAVPDGNIANPEDRWKWINDTMLPEYRKRETQNPDQVMEDMHRMEKVPLKPGGVPNYPID